MKTLILAALLAIPAVAADFDGRWVAKIQTRKGTQEIVFNLKADGERLTGTVGQKRRGIEISDGKITGNEVSFTTTNKGKKQGQPAKMLWKGKIEGNELKGYLEAGRKGRQQPFTAMRQG